jgi:hypothetical protein
VGEERERERDRENRWGLRGGCGVGLLHFKLYGTILSLNTSGSFIVANVNRELLINEPYISHNSLAVKFALLDVPPAC